MQTISKQLEELESKIKRIEILHDEVLNWRENKVTRRFLLETQFAMMCTLDQEPYEGPGREVGSVALRATYIKAMKETFELILSWEPEEFLNL